MKLLPGMFDNGVFPEGEQRWIRILVKNSKKCCGMFQLSDDNPNYKVTRITLSEDYNPTLNSLERVEERVSGYLSEIGVAKSDIQGVKILFQKEVLEFLKDTQKDLKSLELLKEEERIKTFSKNLIYSKEELLSFLDWFGTMYGEKKEPFWNSSFCLMSILRINSIWDTETFTEADFYKILDFLPWKEPFVNRKSRVQGFLDWKTHRKESIPEEFIDTENKIKTYSTEDVLDFLLWVLKEQLNDSDIRVRLHNYFTRNNIKEGSLFTESDFYKIARFIVVDDVNFSLTKIVLGFLTWSTDKEMMQTINAGA